MEAEEGGEYWADETAEKWDEKKFSEKRESKRKEKDAARETS